MTRVQYTVNGLALLALAVGLAVIHAGKTVENRSRNILDQPEVQP